MAWWERAKVGDRVVAVYDKLGEHGYRLTVGTVYEITEIILLNCFDWRGCHVYFGIANDSNPSAGSRWLALCFKPAAPLDKRMDELRGLLDPDRGPWGARQREGADA